MKLSKIEALCKAAKRISIIKDQRRAIQWISDGSACYPLFKLPPLNAENIFCIFDIPEEKQGKIMFTEQDELPSALSFEDYCSGDAVVVPEAVSINTCGRTLIPVYCSTGTILIDKKYTQVFDEDANYISRVSSHGNTYLAVKEGMLLAGIILPCRPDRDLARKLASIGETLIDNFSEDTEDEDVEEE